MPTILITGSSGFVGSATADKFRRRGWTVIGVGRRPTDQSNYLRADLSKPLDASLRRAIEQADVVLHGAARSSPWGTRRQFQLANVVATHNIAEACERSGVPRLLFISSSSVYYRACDQFGITELSELASHPVNQYAATKQQAELRIASYKGSSVIVRPRAVYGRGDTVLFPRILAAARASRLPILTRPGDPVVGDLISIENLTERLFQLAETDQVTGEVNLTDNDPQPIGEFLLSVLERLGLPAPTRHVSVKNAYRAAAAVETLYRCFCPWKEPPITRFGVHVFAYSKTFDVSKMLEQLGPPVQTTAEAVVEFVEWVRQENPY